MLGILTKDIDVSVFHDPCYDHAEVRIIAKCGDKILICKPVELEWKEHEEGKYMEPTFKLGGYMTGPFLKAFATAAKKNGMNPADDLRMEGELKATKYHLEDMRKLLKVK